MKERPILFSGPMVRAILDGRKTQTRRVYKASKWYPVQDGEHTGNPNESSTWTNWGPCQYGVHGNRLWVRETFQMHTTGVGEIRVTYRADNQDRFVNPNEFGDIPDNNHWRPSIFMPRWASRITLEIVSVRVQRVQDITEEDAEAEGANICAGVTGPMYGTYRGAFSRLWDSINSKRGFGWDSNPLVWVVKFRRVNV